MADKARNIAYGYCRVSTSDQDVECKSQKMAIISKYNGEFASEYQWGGFYVDPAVSGATNFADRPAGKILLDRLEEGDIIIASKLDRISRSLRDFADMIHVLSVLKVSVVAMDMGISTLTSVGRMVAHILVSVSEWERDRFRERADEGRALARQLGFLPGGGVMLGFYRTSNKQRMRGNPDEQKMLRQVWEWQANGHGATEILSYLNLYGIKDFRTGNALYTQRIEKYFVAWERIAGTEFDVTDENDYEYQPLNDFQTVLTDETMEQEPCDSSQSTESQPSMNDLPIVQTEG